MILPDVNLLLYATIDAFPHHSRARQWWEEVINSNQPVGLVDPAVFGFLRISTNPRALAPPLSIEDASAHVRSWLSQPNVDRLVGGPNHIHIALDLLQAIGTAGNLTTGAKSPHWPSSTVRLCIPTTPTSPGFRTSSGSTH